MMKHTRGEAMRAVERYYNTGKPCKRGHVAKRYTRSGACYECLKTHETLKLQTFSRLLREKDNAVSQCVQSG